jgi:hypothetical protein
VPTVDRQHAGLCADCQHRQIIETGRSTFLLCRRGLTDPAYRKYPPLPVMTCPGYDQEPESAQPDSADRGDKLSK